MATWTSRSRTSFMRSAISRTTVSEILSRAPRSCMASPLSLSTMRSYTGVSVSMGDLSNRGCPCLESKMREWGARPPRPLLRRPRRAARRVSRAARGTAGEAPALPDLTNRPPRHRVPTQKFGRAHSPLAFQLYFAEGKSAFTCGDNQLLFAAQDLPRLTAEIDDRCGKYFQVSPVDGHQRARPWIEGANFFLNYSSWLLPVDSAVFTF